MVINNIIYTISNRRATIICVHVFYISFWKKTCLRLGDVRPCARVSRHFRHALRNQFDNWYIHLACGTIYFVWIPSQSDHFDHFTAKSKSQCYSFFAFITSKININPSIWYIGNPLCLFDITSDFAKQVVLALLHLFQSYLDIFMFFGCFEISIQNL